MRSYLKNKTGTKLGIIREGMPKEVYFEAELKKVLDDTAVFEGEEGEIALSLDKILLVTPPEELERKTPGFKGSQND
ncbi:MAG: hypothetical protein R6V10_07180 [bacterium]